MRKTLKRILLNPLLRVFLIVPIYFGAVNVGSVTKNLKDQNTGKQTQERPRVAASPQEIRPILIGSKVPSVSLKNAKGESVNLRELSEGKPTVMIFYRGGWCPYCNTHLSDLKKIEDKLLDMGYQILAISPDRPSKIKESLKKRSFNYTLLSDSQMQATRAMGLAFKVDDETLQKYKKQNIDLEAASGANHHELPVPAVIIVNDDRIQFTYANPDYKTRLSGEMILTSARAFNFD